MPPRLILKSGLNKTASEVKKEEEPKKEEVKEVKKVTIRLGSGLLQKKPTATVAKKEPAPIASLQEKKEELQVDRKLNETEIKAIFKAIETYYVLTDKKKEEITKKLEGDDKLERGDILKLLKGVERIKTDLMGRSASRVGEIKPFLPSSFTSLLDIGAGDASITKELSKEMNLDPANVYAIDQTVKKIEGVSYIAYNKDGSFPLKDESIDLVMMLVTYHHIPKKDREMLISEIYRVLKPNGRVLIREHDCPKAMVEKNAFFYMEDLIHYIHSVANDEEEYPADYLSSDDMEADMSIKGFYGAYSSSYFERTVKSTQRLYYNVFFKKNLTVQGAEVTYTVSRKEDVDTKKWLQDLLNRVYAILGSSYVSKELVPLWAKAMTDESYSLSDNWDSFEAIGRSLLSNLCTLYMLSKYPDLSESEYTDFRKSLTSKELMHKFAGRLGLLDLVRKRDLGINSGHTFKIFPSFLGAVYRASSSDEEGIEKCQNLLFTLYNKEEINSKWYEVNPVTQVNQLFNILGEHERIFETGRDGSSFTISVTPLGHRIIRKYAHNLNIRPITVNGANAEESEKMAYEQLYSLLNRSGLNIKWAQQKKQESLRNQTGLSSFYDLVSLENANKNKSIYEGKEYSVSLLVGTKGEKKELISSIIFTDGHRKEAINHILTNSLDVVVSRNKK